MILLYPSEQATDRAEVKVYIVSDNNRVSFLFQNQLTQVEQYRDFVSVYLPNIFINT